MKSIKNEVNFKFNKALAAFIAAQATAFCFMATPAMAEKITTYLAPQYNIDLPAEKAFLSVAPASDPATQKPMLVDVVNDFEKQETATPKGYKVVPFAGAGDYAPELFPYLMKSQEMLDSAKLRIIARMKKYELIKQSGNEQYAEFYKKYVSAPISFFIGFNAGTGPACAAMPLYLDLKDGGYFFFNTVVFIEDIPKMFSIKDSITNDTLDMVVAHENAHGIMYDMYGSQIKIVDKKSNVGHDGPVISDRGLAYIEGWAEAFEALYGPTNPLLKLKEEEREKYRISEFLFTRQDPVRRDRYIWQNYVGKKTGILKNGLQLLSTEGVIAGQFYDILTSRAIKNAFTKATSVMFQNRPKDYIEFLKGWVKLYPEDKKVLYRIFLEGTNYATVSNQARGLYHDYYQAKLKYVKKQMEQKDFYTIKNKWEAFKEDLFANAMQADNIDANIGPDLWLNVPAPPGYNIKNLHVNLSLANPKFLKNMKLVGITDEDIDNIVTSREAMGVLPYKSATEALIQMLGAEKANNIINSNQLTDIK